MAATVTIIGGLVGTLAFAATLLVLGAGFVAASASYFLAACFTAAVFGVARLSATRTEPRGVGPEHLAAR